MPYRFIIFATAASVLVLLTSALIFAQAQPEPPQPEISKFLPDHSTLLKTMPVAFGQSHTHCVAVSYGALAKPDTPFVDGGVRILSYDRHSGWTIAFEETASLINGAGPSDAISIEKVMSADGTEAVVVVDKNSGAGTSTDWHLIADVTGKFMRLDPTAIRSRVLKKRNYVFEGYNGVSAKGDLIIEQVPGYSKGRARCCPDQPTIDISFKFTGTSIKLDSVKELPFSPAPE